MEGAKGEVGAPIPILIKIEAFSRVLMRSDAVQSPDFPTREATPMRPQVHIVIFTLQIQEVAR